MFDPIPRAAWPIASLVFVFTLSTASASQQRTPDGRFGTECYENAGRIYSKELCQVSFYRLLAKPEMYDGRVILVIGYLIDVYGDHVLFANRESYDSGVEVEGIRLIGGKMEQDIEKIENHEKNGAWPVFVIGTFDAKYSGAQLPRLGALKDIQVITTRGLRVNGARPNGPGGP